MGLFGKIGKTLFDVITTPIDVVKDITSFGEEEALKKKSKRLSDDLEEMRNEIDKL